MKKLLKRPNNLVRRVLSKTSNISNSSKTNDQASTSKMKSSSKPVSEEDLACEIRSLLKQVQSLKQAIAALQEDTEKKEIAIARMAREKEKITLELLKQQRSNQHLLQQLEEERKFYYEEKEAYCQEVNQMKKLRQTLSKASIKDDKSLEHYKKELLTMQQTLNHTLEANFNLSIKFLRMKNTKSCLKTQLKTMQLEHEKVKMLTKCPKLVNEYKAKIEDLSKDLNDIIQERINMPISCSSKKYLHLVKQNSCLIYENLCLQLEVDKLNLKFERTKLEKTKSESNSKLQYIKHHKTKPQSSKSKVVLEEERPERDISKIPSTSKASTSEEQFHEVQTIFQNPRSGINESDTCSQQHSVESFTRKKEENRLKMTAKRSSQLTLFQVSEATSSQTGSLKRVRSSPEITPTKFTN